MTRLSWVALHEMAHSFTELCIRLCHTSLEKGIADHVGILAMNSMKRQKDMTMNHELPRSVGAQYATGEEWRNNSRKNEETEPKQRQHPVVDVTGMEVKFDAVKNNIA